MKIKLNKVFSFSNLKALVLFALLFSLQTTTHAADQKLYIKGEASEISGTTTSSIVTPAVGPQGALVLRGKGIVTFTPVKNGNGVSFGLGGQQSASTAFYQFKGQNLSTIFNNQGGEIHFYLKSNYSFAERKLLTRYNKRFAFEVTDGSKVQFSFNTLTGDSGNLIFEYTVAGVSDYYFVPKGQEDTLYGKGAVMKVDIVWSPTSYTLSVNDVVVKKQTIKAVTPNWSPSASLSFGAATDYGGGFFSSNDAIDDFKVLSGQAIATPSVPVVPAATSTPKVGTTTSVPPVVKPAPIKVVPPVTPTSTNQIPKVATSTTTTTSPPVVPPVTPSTLTTSQVNPIPLTNYKSGIPAFNPQLDVVAAPTGFGTGKLWQVGPTRKYKKPSEVAPLVQAGDVVEIEAATYKCDDSVKWSVSFLTLRGVGGRPILDSTKCSIAGGKGIWNPTYQMSNMIIDNVEFMGAAVSDRNGAGIRYDGGGYLYITNSYFHDNENGVLITPGSAADIVIDHSEFARNGGGDGYTHNMYISGISKSFVLRFSYSHEAHIGHEVKSRAQTNYILYNRITTEAKGDSSYNIDLPQGGLTYIIGNIIQQGQYSPNYGIISYSAEGTHNPVQKVYISHNTIVNEGISDTSVRVVNLYDNGLTEAKMVNNLIVGAATSSVVGYSPSKMTMINNLITSNPGFYDRANRIYYLTATSSAIDSAVDAGVGDQISLSPLYQFAFPATGEVRTKLGKASDVGGYEYNGVQVITPAPKITFKALKTAVDYNTPVMLTWSTSNTTACQAAGGWSGNLATSGSYITKPLTANQTFSIFCSGTGGTASIEVQVTVNDSPQAVAMGAYSWQEVSGSKIESVGADLLKNASGTYVYANNFGTGPYVGSKATYATGVYVPDTKRWYLMGGASGRNYYGNEIYAFNFETMKSERVTEPTDIGLTKEYYPSDLYNSKIHITGCNGILHLTSGGIAPAPRGIVGTAGYNPLTKKIVVGPSGFVPGVGDCTGSNAGQNATDMWSFDPIAKTWSLVAPEDDRFGSVTTATWFIDPATGISYTASNRNGATRGAYLINSNASTKPDVALVDNVWPFQIAQGVLAIDTTNRYAMQFGVPADSSTQSTTPRVAMYNLNGISLTKYGTSGQKGSTGTAGGPGSMYEPDTTWSFTGETSVLGMSDVALTYNSKLNKFVAWAGGDIIYFLTPNYQTKTINILSKHVYSNPSSSVGVANKFTYIPDRDIYLAFVGTNKNFFILKPSAIAVKNSQDGVVLGAFTSKAMIDSQDGLVLGAFTSKVTCVDLSRNLHRGAESTSVTQLQDFLAQQGFLNDSARGFYGDKTVQAVKDYQTSKNLGVTGMVYDLTRNEIKKDSCQ